MPVTSPRPSNASPQQLFLALPSEEQQSFLTGLSDDEKAHLAYEWRGWLARPNQLPPPGEWLFWLVLAGRGFGKTRVGAEWVREQVKTFERVALIGKDATDMNSVMIDGESGIMAVCPPWERPVHVASKRILRWPNGAISDLRSGEDPEGVRGLQCHRLWADELAAWEYAEEAWDMAVLGTRLPPDPRALVTTTPKPRAVIQKLVENPNTVVTSGSTYDNLHNLGATFRDMIFQYEGTRLGRQEIHAELLLDEGLAYRFSEHVHVVPAFDVPKGWERFESMDYGSTHPTCWLAIAIDYDGNLIVFDEVYAPALPSETAPAIHERRKWWHPAGRPVCYADPSVYDGKGVTNRWGRPATVASEFKDCGIDLIPGNRDRVAGHVRIAELLRIREERTRPAWAGPGDGSPSIFIFDRCHNLIEQLKRAPLEEEKEPHPGEAVSRKWEGPHGHAHAALRYGVLSWPGPSVQPEKPLLDPRAELMRKLEQRENAALAGPGRYVDV